MAISISSASASLPGHRLPAPETIAPVNGSVVNESAVRFAWNAPSGAAYHYLLLSRAPFDPSKWTELPNDPAIQVFRTSEPLASLTDLGVTLAEDTRFYWAAASVFSGKGQVSFSAVQSSMVRRKFTNRVEPSPYLAELGVSHMTPAPTDGRHLVHLGSGYTIDPAMGEPAIPTALRESLGAGKAPRTLLVAYGDRNPDETRASILEAGGMIVAYVPDHAFLVRMRGGGAAPEGAAQSALQAASEWVGTYQPAYKLSPQVALESEASAEASVLVFQDGDLAAVRADVAAIGANVVAESDNGLNKILRITATGAQLQGLAQHEDVAWIEPYVQPQLFNDNAQWVVQTGANGNRRVWDMGIHGEGQVVMTSDSGVNMSHYQFYDALVPVSAFGEYPTHRKVIAYESGSTNPDVTFGDHGVYHGTHTACSAVGNDEPNAASLRDGMAKGGKLWHMDISGPALGSGVDPFLDLNDLFQPSYDGNAGGAARLSSNSWGAPLLGAYTLSSQQVDQFMWNHKDYLIVFANGNSGAVGTVASPATAKNLIGAGGTGNGTSLHSLYTTTSRGPTADGRQKPTICSPGQSVVSASTGTGGYQSLSGTSMASPTMTGAIALIRQYLTDGWYPTGVKVPGNAFDPSAALVKAMAINSAANDITGQVAPNNNIGYGRILVDDVCYFAGDTKRLLLVDNTEGLGHQDAIEFQVNVTAAAQPLEVTLCWTDYPGSPTSSIQLVNDLNLELISPTATTYLGNVYSGGYSTTGGSPDDRDVEEACLIQSAATGIWTIRVEGFNVPFGPQPFALAITGAVGTTGGSIALDRASYGSGSTVEMQVIDTNAGPTVDVNIQSDTESSGETVTLAETGDGVYTGSIALSPFDGGTADGFLQVSHGDVITATYDDGAPSLFVAMTAQATVSFATPVITNIGATKQGAGAVSITWDTDLNASSQVYYGTTPALGSSTAIDATAALSHSVLIEGLTAGQTYYFDVESQALNGNVTRDDNGGNHYQVTVEDGADILIVYGGDIGSREARYVDALAANGWSYDLWSAGQYLQPTVGDLDNGLRSYKAVWWQVGLEEYPPFSDDARDSITAYLDGGGRLAVVGHDIAWSFGDVTSSFYSVDASNWLQNTLHTIFNADPAGWPSVTGVTGDPISGAYTGGLSYTEHRSGASGDEIDVSNGAGTATASWRSGDVSPDDCGLRWESTATLGTPGTGYWGGEKSRLATMYFEWSGIENASDPSSAARTDVLDKTLVWLLGHDKPDVSVTSPNGGETITTSSTDIEWTEAAFGGASVDVRKIEYSPDGGLSWHLVEANAGPSPYSWDLSAVGNTPNALVRITLTDDGSPAYSSVDVSDATFSIERPGGDLLGPVVVAGSIASSPNPIDNQNAATLTATVSDVTTGGSAVMAAEWSFGGIAAPAGTGQAMTGSFGTPSVAVSANLPTSGFSLGTRKLWVRGQDDAGHWGAARALSVVINGIQPLGVSDSHRDFALWQNVPNPVRRNTVISYSVPVASSVDLSIYDVQGRVLRRLVRGNVAPGSYQVGWDGTDDQGRAVGPGIYYYRFIAGDRVFERKLVTLR